MEVRIPRTDPSYPVLAHETREEGVESLIQPLLLHRGLFPQGAGPTWGRLGGNGRVDSEKRADGEGREEAETGHAWKI